jgi:hypothetical protein
LGVPRGLLLRLSFHRTLQIPVVRGILPNHPKRECAWGEDGKMGEVVEKFVNALGEPPGSYPPATRLFADRPNGFLDLSLNILGPDPLVPAPEFLDTSEEPLPALPPFLKLPDRDDGGHGAAGALDHVLVAL